MNPSLTPISQLASSKDYEHVAKRWYELLCALDPDFSEDADEDPLTWDELREGLRKLMIAVVINLIAEGTIR